jgi:hypothetical protein
MIKLVARSLAFCGEKLNIIMFYFYSGRLSLTGREGISAKTATSPWPSPPMGGEGMGEPSRRECLRCVAQIL